MPVPLVPLRAPMQLAVVHLCAQKLCASARAAAPCAGPVKPLRRCGLKSRAAWWLNCHGRLDHQIRLWAECGVSFCAQRGEPYRSQATVWGHGGADYGRIQLRVELYYD